MQKKMKKVFSIIMATIMIMCMMPKTAMAETDTSSLQPGTNTEGYYELDSSRDLLWFAQKVNSEGEENKSINAVMTGDIDVSDIGTWTPIGSSSAPFNGTFDGGNHKITGISWSFTSANSALFGVSTGTIKNIADMTGTITSTGNFTGGIVGTNKGDVIDSKVSVDFILNSACKPSGGIAGGNYTRVHGCEFAGTLKLGDEVTSMTQIGGIVGCLYKTAAIVGCVNSGEINGNNSASGTIGGIAGRIDGEGTSILNCYNTGKVTGTGSYTNLGGIVGICNKLAVIANCYNVGDVIDINSSAVAPLIGKLGSSASSQELLNSYYLSNDDEPVEPAVSEEMLKSEEFIGKINKKNNEYAVDEKYNFVSSAAGPVHISRAKVSEPVEVKTVTIVGENSTGAKLTAKAVGENGEAATKVKYQWQKYVTMYDPWDEEYSDWEDIEGATKASYDVDDSRDALDCSYRVTVTGENSSAAESEMFTISVLSDRAKASEAADKIKLLQDSKVYDVCRIDLPVTGENGAQISWKSSNSEYITDEGEVTKLPETKTVKINLTATVTVNSGSITKDFGFEIYSSEAQKDAFTLNQISEAFQWGVFSPTYGTDTNIIDFVSNALKEKGFEGVTVSLDSIEKASFPNGGEAAISEDGDLTYFYADPTTLNKSPFYNSYYGKFNVKFKLSKGDAVSELAKGVQLYWNTDKLYAALKTQIADKIDWDLIKGENTEKDSILKPLYLPRYLGGKTGGNMLCEIVWTSSNPAVISVSDDKNDVISGDYVCSVNRDTTDQKVVLTATFDYKDVEGDKRPEEAEAINKLRKTFEFTVPALDVYGITAKMQKQLDENYSLNKLKDSISGDIIDADAVAGDIQLLTPGKTGVEDSDSYKFSVTSSDPDVIDINGYRANVYRPLPGEESKEVTLTVRMSQKANSNIYVEKQIKVKIKPLEQQEIDAAKVLMQKTVENYFAGIKGENTDKNNITKDMKTFQEAILDEDGNVKFIYNFTELNGSGIAPVTYVEETESGGSDDQYTFFNSNRGALIQKGNLRILSEVEYDTKVTVDSYLSSKVFGKYYTKYAAKGDNEAAAIFAPLYRQHASADIIVKGEKGADPNPVSEFNVSLSIKTSDGKYWLNTLKTKVERETTAGDVVSKLLKENGFTYTGGASYISGITSPNGVTLAEKDMGENSGWMYRVNGNLPDKTLAQYVLKENDVIQLFYTADYTQEPEKIAVDDSNRKMSMELPNKDNKEGKTECNGEKLIYKKGVSKSATFRLINGDVDKLVNVSVNGVVVDSSNYTVKKGSILVTFDQDYLDSLPIGSYNVRINTEEGYGESSMDIVKTAKETPSENTQDGTDQNSSADTNSNDNNSSDKAKENQLAPNGGIVKTGDANDMCAWLFVIILAVSFIAVAMRKKEIK